MAVEAALAAEAPHQEGSLAVDNPRADSLAVAAAAGHGGIRMTAGSDSAARICHHHGIITGVRLCLVRISTHHQ